MRKVIHGGQKLIITEQGEPAAEIVPLPRIDRKAALAALQAIGPVSLPPRK